MDFWQGQVAFSGGNSVITDFLYDPNVGALYGYREDDLKCANGQAVSGGILEALYAQGNMQKKPVYGCKFDANGNATECGAAVINSQAGDLEIAVAE